MKTMTELSIETLKHEDLDKVLMLVDECILPDEMHVLVDQRVEWRDGGLCDECGGSLRYVNNGYNAPDPEMWEWECTQCL